MDTKDKMEINEALKLRSLHVDMMGNFMKEFVVTAPELRGLFKCHASKAVDDKF